MREKMTKLRIEGQRLSESLANPVTWVVAVASIVLAVSGNLLPALMVGLLVIPVNLNVEYGTDNYK